MSVCNTSPPPVKLIWRLSHLVVSHEENLKASNFPPLRKAKKLTTSLTAYSLCSPSCSRSRSPTRHQIFVIVTDKFCRDALRRVHGPDGSPSLVMSFGEFSGGLQNLQPLRSPSRPRTIQNQNSKILTPRHPLPATQPPAACSLSTNFALRANPSPLVHPPVLA
jgi:hypothetical protein